MALLAGAAISLAIPAAAKAAPAALVRLHIPAKPVADALVDLALQTGVSLGGDLGACQGAAPEVIGRMTVQDGLARLLRGSSCGFLMPDRLTVVIRRAAPSRPPLAAERPEAARPAPPPILVDPLPEIVVTAPRHPDLPGRTPYAVTAFSGDELRRLGALDLNAVSLQVAGMTTTNLGPGRNKIFLRGLSDGVFTGLTQSIVGLYLDDTPITYNAPDPDLRLVDVDRVEVLRGPQGTLYGAGSIGGIVRIVTRKPDLDEASASLLGEITVPRSGGLGQIVEATVNAPLSPGRLALRASAFREAAPGYIDDVGLGKTNINRSTRSGGRAALGLRLSDDWSATLGGVHQSINTLDTQYAFRSIGRLKRSSRLAEPHDNDFDDLTLSIEGKGPWGRLTASTGRLVHQLDSRYDATDSVGLFAPGETRTAAFDDAQRIDLWVNEVTFASPVGGRFQWLAGAFASVGKTTATGDLQLLAPATALYSERRRDKVDEIALYGEANARLTERLALTLGARWFRFRFDTRSDVVQGGVRAFSGEGDASGLSPKLMASYRLNPQLLFYAQASEGYRVGGFNTSGPIGQAFEGGAGDPSRSYDPDKLWNYEAGVKARLLDGRLNLRGAGFISTWRNIQTNQFLASGLPYTLNVGDGRNSGFEIEAAWRPIQALDLRLAGLIDNPELTRRNPAFTSSPDAGLPGVPKLSGSVGMTYRRALSDRLSLRVDASAAYLGASTVTFDAQRVFRMGDYVTAKVSASLARGDWRLTASIDNPMDSAANTFAFGNPFRIGKVQETTPLRPRTLNLQLAVDF